MPFLETKYIWIKLTLDASIYEKKQKHSEIYEGQFTKVMVENNQDLKIFVEYQNRTM